MILLLYFYIIIRIKQIDSLQLFLSTQAPNSEYYKILTVQCTKSTEDECETIKNSSGTARKIKNHEIIS